MKEGALPGIPLQLRGAEGGIAGPVRSLAFVFCFWIAMGSLSNRTSLTAFIIFNSLEH